MGASIYKLSAADRGPIGEVGEVPVGAHYRLVSVSVRFAIAPVTSEPLTITLDAAAGPAWDVLLYTVDPGAGGITDLVWQPDEELFFEGGDEVLVAYANTDTRDWALQITFKRVM